MVYEVIIHNVNGNIYLGGIFTTFEKAKEVSEL